MTRTKRAWQVACFMGLGVASISAQAGDDKTPNGPHDAAVRSEILILHATNGGGGIDPKLGKMPELAKPPFSAYSSYKLLERVTLPLSRTAPSTTKLPNDRVLQISLKDAGTKDEKKAGPKTFVVSASIDQADGKHFLPLLEVSAKAGETFFVAGQNYKGGMLVLGIKVLP